ncbi:MAG: hypothetical protein NUV58_03260 [Candidatus Roizmanbacteria bacterium]|nr:hypothetical protein [Candidatus Roizmanbacteria bacterium]
MVKIQTNLNNFSVVDEIKSLFSGLENDYNLKINEYGVIVPDVQQCPCCKRKLSKNGYNECKDKRAKGFGLVFKKGRIICPTKGCRFVLNIPQSALKQWFARLMDFIESTVLSLRAKKVSSSDIAQHLKETHGISFSDEYIRLKIKELTNQIELPTPQQKSSGVVVHDEQFVKIKGIDLKRISTVDANNPNVYYDELHTNRTEDTMIEVCQEIKNNLKEVYAAVMDGHIASKNAYNEVFPAILIQYCLFHFAKNVRDAYKEEVGYGKGKSMIPLQHLIGFFSILNIFFNHEREIERLRCLQKELNENIERINSSNYSTEKKGEYVEDYMKKYDQKASRFLRNIRNARRRKNGIKLELRTEEQAKELLEKAKMENVFPKQVQKQINRLEKEWVNFTHCLRDKTIPPTSNKVEQFYSLTLNWVEKRTLQSEEQFYLEQKFSLIKRYKIPLIKEGIFSNFLRTTFVMLLTFGGT